MTSEIDWPTPHVDWQIRESPDICDELVRAIDDLKSQLLVVGHKGENAIKRFLKGSIARRITHHAPCSILVVKSEQ